MSNAIVKQNSLMAKLGNRYGVDGSKLYDCLKATAFKVKNGEPQASDSQMMALMVVSDQYGLNPFTKEIYAFPDKNNGIVPVVGVDGWSRIINTHEQFDGMTFEQDAESCTCTIYRKDRAHPISATEYMDECKRNTGPWNSHPRRMLRHKAMIQAARLAFGYVGIYDQDEAERIIETDINGQVEVREPVAMPRKKIAEPVAQTEPEPECASPQPDTDAPFVVGEVEAISKKTGESKKGKWTKYGIKVSGEFYGTFSDTDAATAQEAKDCGGAVKITYSINERGYRDLLTIEPDVTPEPESGDAYEADDLPL